VRQVAAGDLTPKVVFAGRDELGGLTRSFADMTQQLADARAAVETQHGAAGCARANLQTILDNLTAGVIVLDARWPHHRPTPAPRASCARRWRPSKGRPWRRCRAGGLCGAACWPSSNLPEVSSQHGLDHWQQSFELHAPSQGMPKDMPSRWCARRALPGGQRLLVFDDITEVVSAQRAPGLGRGGPRLAHEIKNPLTPIQLSAERLQHEAGGQAAEPRPGHAAPSVATIVNQVDAMKRLVNEFRDYARLPAAS
jgi:nitrogen fixation/metabolism regulation signal transduction histidine kinase